MPMDFWAAAMPSGSAVQQVTYTTILTKTKQISKFVEYSSYLKCIGTSEKKKKKTWFAKTTNISC
jgi:hypothetical protein